MPNTLVETQFGNASGARLQVWTWRGVCCSSCSLAYGLEMRWLKRGAKGAVPLSVRTETMLSSDISVMWTEQQGSTFLPGMSLTGTDRPLQCTCITFVTTGAHDSGGVWELWNVSTGRWIRREKTASEDKCTTKCTEEL
jgi:hypothetical protein